MSESESLPPSSDLFISMRNIGYSLETAIADIIDNSIAANAKIVKINFDNSAEYIAIIDNGSGMTKDELRTAMRMAGKNPKTLRAKTDLGRFGLGLKTASLSQCRKLTVVSKQNSELVAAEWDLDLVESKADWVLSWLSKSEIDLLPEMLNLMALKSGTMVLWRNFDVMLRDDLKRSSQMNEKMRSAEEHLRLVFHRFLDGLPQDSVQISLNGNKLKAIDPFFSSNIGTQQKPEQTLNLSGGDVKVKPFVLPHLSQLNLNEREESEFLSARFKDVQGFYIYRLKRLISFGSWFRLTPRSELSKMARVRVDVSPDLDHLFQLSVDKSKVEPPQALKDKLKLLVPEITKLSSKVVTKTGTLLKSPGALPGWLFRDLTNQTFRLEIDRQHPLLANLDSVMTQDVRDLLEDVLWQLEYSLPIEDLMTRILNDKSVDRAIDAQQVLSSAQSMLLVIKKLVPNFEEALIKLLNIEPFASDPQIRELINREKSMLRNKFSSETGGLSNE